MSSARLHFDWRSRSVGLCLVGCYSFMRRDNIAVVKMMEDTSVATVNRHYFTLEDDLVQEIIDSWRFPR